MTIRARIEKIKRRRNRWRSKLRPSVRQLPEETEEQREQAFQEFEPAYEAALAEGMGEEEAFCRAMQAVYDALYRLTEGEEPPQFPPEFYKPSDSP